MKIKIIIFITISSICTFSNAQSLKGFLYTANFNTPNNKPYIETYLSFDANSVQLVQDKNAKYYGQLDIYMEITNNDNLIYNDHYLLKSPYFEDSTRNNLLFIDQHRISIKNGEYLLTIRVKDLNYDDKELVLSENITMDFEQDKLAISDITLIEKYEKTKKENKLSKSGFNLTPYASNFYQPHQNTLSFYFEIYNTDKYFEKDKKYLLSTYIESFETNVPLFDFSISKRMETKDIYTKLITFPIEKLTTGNYNLVCEIKDVNNQSVLLKKLFFQRSGKRHDKSLNDISSIDIQGTFAEQITSIDSMLLFIDYLYPISTSQEMTFANNQKKYNNLLLMQKYFLNFWKGVNLYHPEKEWRKYKAVLKSVNKEFQNGRIPGYRTDRGRVYLQYGAPNSRNKVDNSSANVPYEIWHYYKLKNQSDRKFVFVNEHLGIQDYRLTYSNVDGEVSNAAWRDEIEQNQTPTFGDDFNNNYINPR